MSANDELMANLIKGDQTFIQVGLGRGRGSKNQGLVVTVKALPHVEDFMRGLGNGEELEVNPLLGRHWQAIGDQLLKVYNLQDLGNPKRLQAEDGTVFCIDRPGHPLFLDANSVDDPNALYNGPTSSSLRPPSAKVLNLSYLRLVGISEGFGVSFTIPGVYELEELVRLRDKIVSCNSRFYRGYIKPVQFNIEIIGSVQSFNPPPYDLPKLADDVVKGKVKSGTD